MNIRRTRTSLHASILAACVACIASSAGCGSCAGDDTSSSSSTSSPVNGSGGPGSKPIVGRRPSMRMNPIVVGDSAAPDPAPAPSGSSNP